MLLLYSIANRILLSRLWAQKRRFSQLVPPTKAITLCYTFSANQFSTKREEESDKHPKTSDIEAEIELPSGEEESDSRWVGGGGIVSVVSSWGSNVTKFAHLYDEGFSLEYGIYSNSSDESEGDAAKGKEQNNDEEQQESTA